MEKTILLPLFLFMICPVFGAEPEKYREPREAIAAAKEHDRMIFFLLTEGFEAASQKVEAAMEEAVRKQDGDFFVLGICQHRNLSHRSMFEDRFKKDISKAPVAVICDSAGNEITGCYGKDPELYVNLLRFARLKAGKFGGKEEENRLKNQIAKSDDLLVDSIFGLTRSMVEVKKELLSPQRIWKFKDGKRLRAALLTADGPRGTFVRDEDGEEVMIDFNTLSEGDVSYLQQLLSQ